MFFIYQFQPLFFIILTSILIELSLCVKSDREVFTNSFLVRLKGNYGHEVANHIAKRNGFVNLGPVSISKLFYVHIYFD